MSSPLAPVSEPARITQVCHETDLCVVGGSCTGVFAAVRAARLGLSVCIIEQNTMLRGMAVAAQVNEWHSTWDAALRRRIIGGLTLEISDRLRRRGALEDRRPILRGEFVFNSAELAVELDELVREHRIRVFLAAVCVDCVRDETRRAEAVIIEDRSGRRAVRARMFVDASGDGAFMRAAGFPLTRPASLQPVNLQAVVAGLSGVSADEFRAALAIAVASRGYPSSNGTPWRFAVPGAAALTNLFGARLHGYDAADADDYTRALMEGRRCHRAFVDSLREALAGPSDTPPVIAAWAPALGVRQTRHAVCAHRLTGDDLLSGRSFPDTIAQGTYPIDIHAPEGVFLGYLDGRQEHVARDGSVRWDRWRDETAASPDFYSVPFRSLLPQGAKNILVAGRLLDADREAFGGVRVMVNMNQTGEAAGTAAALAIRAGIDLPAVSSAELRATLNQHGSLLF